MNGYRRNLGCCESTTPCEVLMACQPDEESTGFCVDFVIPVFNEERVLLYSVNRLLAVLREVPYEFKIVVVNNGSTDNTSAIAWSIAELNHNCQVIDLEEKGRGRALRHAWSVSEASFSIYMDVDLSTDLAAIPDAIAYLQAGADIVAGSRLSARSQVSRSFSRSTLSWTYNRFVRHALHHVAFEDAQCGFKGIRVHKVRPLLQRIENCNWFFDTELLVRAEQAGLSIINLPVRWTENKDSRVKIIPTVCEEFLGVMRLRRQALVNH